MKSLAKLHDISKSLESSGIEFPDKEAEIILRNVLHINLVVLYRDDPELSIGQVTAIDAIVRRRCNREPLQYILGSVEFMGLRMLVGKGVLIPRPETELMAEIAIKECRDWVVPPLTILDLCTGSGCLALALAREFPEARVCGVDVSEAALQYARSNAELNKIDNVSFFQGDLFKPFYGRGCPATAFDLLISNPPYIRTGDLNTLQPEIRDWEPVSALDGGADGMDIYRMIIPAAGQFLKPKGMIMLELGAGQADAVSRILKESGYRDVGTVKDYSGIERIVQARN